MLMAKVKNSAADTCSVHYAILIQTAPDSRSISCDSVMSLFISLNSNEALIHNKEYYF